MMTESIWLKIVDKAGMGSSDNQKEIIAYGLSKLATITVNVIILAVIGHLFGVTIESLLYLISFMLLRMYSGGYHAPTKLICFIVSYVLEIVAVLFIYFATMLLLFLLIETVICLTMFLFSPIESQNKPLSITERRMYGRRAFGISVLYTILSAALMYAGADKFALAIFTTMTQVFLMMIPGIWNKLFIFRA